MEHVEQNLASADASDVDVLTDGELELVAKVREQYSQLCPIPCTKCSYCMPCPSGVDIPGNFAAYNEGVMYDNPDEARESYQWINEDARASACVQCRQCEELCPQHIVISEWMPVVHGVLGEGDPYVCELP
ncbi:MAG: hypothetical protein GX620_13775 [Chloroflexi bacterium]|nr:hypothetical protein [Chloroflexota bacterium]